MSFRFRLILGVVAIQGLLLLILVWNGLHALRVSNEEGFLARANMTARLFASSSQAAVLATDLGSLESAVQEITADPGVVYARVYGGDQLLAEAGDPVFLARPFIADRSLVTVRGGVYDKSATIMIAEKQYGKIELGFSVDTITRLLDRERDQTLLLALADLVLIVVFAIVIGLYVSRKLESLRQASAHIARGEFGYKVDVRGRDELARTAQAFNEMSSQLEQLDALRREAETKILALNQDLERRVNLRTNELVTLNSELEHQALHDALTKLPNRTLFNDRLQQAIRISTREKKCFALVVVDLDLFKEINDTHGHHAGDLVLQEVANRSRQVLRDSDTVARMGGDEFGILLLNVVDAATAQTLTLRLLQAVREPLKLEGLVLEVSASMGIALFSEHGVTAEELTRHADAAMYAAKRHKSGFVLYNAELDRTGTDQVALKGELRRALADGQLVLHYQPKFEMANAP